MTHDDYRSKVKSAEWLKEFTSNRPKLVPIGDADLDEPMYVLIEDFMFEAHKTFTIQAGYVYDGASIWSRLGLTWALTVSPFDPRVMRAALKHDVLCDIEPWFFSSVKAADMFGRDCLADGIPERKVRRMVWAVKRFGPKWGMQ